MIQRVQTLWLLLAALAIFSLFLVPSFTSTEANVHYVVNAMGINAIDGAAGGSNNNLLLIFSVLMAGLISVLNIFNFKNRAFQKRICLLSIVLLAMLSFWFFQLAKQLPAADVNLKMSIGAFLSPLAILFTFLALRGVQHDERLIKSADRLR